jgi:hypothetical protein
VPNVTADLRWVELLHIAQVVQQKPLEVRIDLPEVIKVVVNPFMQEFLNRDAADPWMDTAAAQVCSTERLHKGDTFCPHGLKFIQKGGKSLFAIAASAGDFILIIDLERGLSLLKHSSHAANKVTMVFFGQMANDLFCAPLSNVWMPANGAIRKRSGTLPQKHDGAL